MTYIADKALRLRYEFGRVRRDSAAKQIGLRRIRSVVQLANGNPEVAGILLAEAERYLLQARAYENRC